MLSRSDVEALLEAVRAISHRATTLIVEKLDAGFTFRQKADRSFVTEIDIAAEELIRDAILRQFPDHGIVGEELGSVASDAEFQWTIDPIDGTMSLRHGIPLFGSIVGVTFRGAPLVGVIALPQLGRTYYAGRDLGAWRNDTRISIHDVENGEAIEDEVIATGERRQFVRGGRAEEFDRLMTSHPSVRTYCDCFGHGLAAEGSVGAMLDFDLRAWDIGATEILITEAGGKFVRLGGEGSGAEARHDLLFGKPAVVDWVIDTIRYRE
ncbi:MAG: inositol monophosphatase [Thermoanaerobaculia bacterium]